MRIAFASSDWSNATSPPTPGGAGWYRCALPAAALAERGHETKHGLAAIHGDEICVQSPAGFIYGGFDIVVLQRYMGDDLVEAIPKAQAAGQIIVNDLDDWYFGLDPTNKAFWASHPKNQKDVNRDHYRHIIAISDAVIASTPYLAARLQGLFPQQQVTTIRNAIDLDRWQRRPIRDVASLTIGWVGATPWRSGDLEILQGILGPWLQAHDARFYHGGHTDTAAKAAASLGVNGPSSARMMQPIGDYPELFEGIDIGIAPMRDAPFNYAKSAIKGMEYAASGIPYVASRLPEYEWFAQGLLARRPHDWMRHLTALIDPKRRQELADAAYARVQRENITSRVVDWERVFTQLITRKKAKTSGIPETARR